MLRLCLVHPKNQKLFKISYSCFFLFIIRTDFYAILEYIFIHYLSIFLYVIVSFFLCIFRIIICTLLYNSILRWYTILYTV